jgi:hypothetical protein
MLELIVEAHVVHALKDFVLPPADSHGPVTPAALRNLTSVRHNKIIAARKRREGRPGRVV